MSQNKITKLENEIRKKKETLAKLRRKAPRELVQDYEFQLSDGRKTRLSSLFGKKRELILIHNMGSSCPFCTLWADGFNGIVHHLEDRAAFVLETPDRPATQKKFARKRGWKFKMISSAGTSFKKDMKMADDKGMVCPGASTFVKDKGKIYRVANTVFGPGDNFCIAWDLFDLLPDREWWPKFSY